MNEIEKTIAMLDNKSSEFGFSQGFGFGEEFGLADLQNMHPAHVEQIKNVIAAHRRGMGHKHPHGGPGTGGNTNPAYSLNPAINSRTKGKSTFMVNISASQTGTGSGNTFNPIFLFGGESFNNSSTPYIQVNNAGQAVSLSVSGGKNVVNFTYGGGGNSTKYTVTLGTTGEYPFILNSLVGTNKMQVHGVQTQISDATQQDQLTSAMNTFYFDEFGKATTDDLTTPKDLYQQQTNGIFYPHEFEISGKRGLEVLVKDINNFSVQYYFYATPHIK